ncbi:alpha/beta hydrolase [Paenibacillus macerans]|uniref:alpha/beta hydrolase n=1 Tax=Paenibacillus macerans TaxID=44252 RepID=UPI00203CE1FB|nr:alpha/beta hydrolase [Paenibacillus macerans]MCM3699361.1 alpha/beta hydrolase [Paenibacillus macerans]
MKADIVKVPSFWNAEMNHKYIQVTEEKRKLAVLFPGLHYSCDKPVLHYAGAAAVQNGFDLLALEYGYQAARVPLQRVELPKVIEDIEKSLRPIVTSYEEIVFIGKSLGTVVAGEVAGRLGVPVRHLYLTPVRETIPYINQSAGVVVYGTKDELFCEEMAKQIAETDTRKVIAIPDADHSLEGASIHESMENLRTLADIFTDFLGN